MAFIEVHYLNPRKGTETGVLTVIFDDKFSVHYLNPRKGTETIVG